MITAHPKDSEPVAKSPELTRLPDDDSVLWEMERIMRNISGLIPALAIVDTGVFTLFCTFSSNTILSSIFEKKNTQTNSGGITKET